MKISFIGCGNMATAIIGGILAGGLAEPRDITASAPTEATRTKAEETFGIGTTSDNAACARGSDAVVLAVKPIVFDTAAKDIADVLTEDQLVISIAAGVTLERMAAAFGEKAKCVRVMPNTPALVGEGISGWCANDNVTEGDKKLVHGILTSFGEAEEVPERLMSVVTSVSGSSPAYVFMFIEAMADAAVLDGMPRAKAYHFAAQTVLGAAKMVLKTGDHPGKLKDMVTSPAGTTIEGVAALERGNFRGTVISAVHACTEKAEKI
ncbi:MAG: pyrroline-5-carboxylate reductase [Lachnospiraceae bacterium]|nr:pyrroline-5-carboxylate reductase [Lachnospiraceae bacterium]